ncbi:hypothetical protein H8S11_05055 [Flintibacter sp. NSJ-23]|uniref:Uncharacterized protein n=1 Tax=Flintibacter hominis TaxID=2763048 RepID=A0A8J6M7Y4_9FIRM|nr:hypothetical protein [Flintibacter hominis]MBC5722182.1 hypothetical protein [Flintibacter hominis]
METMETRVPEALSFWNENVRKALKIKDWKTPNQLVRMNSPVQIRIVAPQNRSFWLKRAVLLCFLYFLAFLKFAVRALTTEQATDRKNQGSGGAIPPGPCAFSGLRHFMYIFR